MTVVDGFWIGVGGGLAAAACWATGSLLFSRIHVPAAGLNLYKNGFASVLIGITLCGWALVDNRPLLVYHASGWAWLAISSIVGLLIGDTLYFRSLQILGPRRGSALALSIPPMAALLSWWILGESPGGTWIGMVITLVGVGWVIRERSRHVEEPGLYPGSVTKGVLCGLGAALCQAIGSVWSKQGMQGDIFPGLPPGGPIPELDASLARLLSAFLAGLLLHARELRSWITPIRAALGRLSLAAFFGTFLGIWMSLTAYKHASVAIATTLTSLVPVFMIPLVVVFLGVRVSRGAIIAVLVALLGVALLVGAGFSDQAADALSR